jgi:hypothetical protein
MLCPMKNKYDAMMQRGYESSSLELTGIRFIHEIWNIK